MSKTQQELTDVTIHPPGTRMRGVKGLDVEWRPWIAGFPECPALNQHRIIHVGIMNTTERTIEAIAQDVGFENPYVFSNAFTKWIGWRPSEYRRKKLPTNHRRKSLSDRAVGRGSRLSDAARR